MEVETGSEPGPQMHWDGPEEGPGNVGMCTLRITKNYETKTRLVEMCDGRIRASEEDARDEEIQLRPGFRLTIRSNNSVIRIQGFDDASSVAFADANTKSKKEDEIEKEETDGTDEKTEEKEEHKLKKRTWKMLAKSVIGNRSERRGSVERYPKIVLLQEPKRKEEISKEEREQPSNEEESLTSSKTEGNFDLMENEKYCVKLERQVLVHEKAILRERMEILRREREMLQREKMILENEKMSLEKRKQEGEVQLNEDIEEVFGGILKLESKKQPEKQSCSHRESSGGEDVVYSSVPPFYCQYPGHCPSVYVPVYEPRSIPFFQRGNEFSCRSEISLKHSTTQTENLTGKENPDPLSEEPKLELPFEVLSSFFPRIVLMKSYQGEVPESEERTDKIIELPRSPTAKNENEKEYEEESDQVDATKRVEDPYLGKETFDDLEEVVDASEKERLEDLPLTKIGHSICDKLAELTSERKRGQLEKEEGFCEKESSSLMSAPEPEKRYLNITIHLGNGAASFSAHDHPDVPKPEEEKNKPVPGRKWIEGDNDDRVLVRKSELWHSSNGSSEKGTSLQLPYPLPEQKSAPVGSFFPEIVFTVGRVAAKDAKVGTDDASIAGGHRERPSGVDLEDLSPRTDRLLAALKTALEPSSKRDKNTRDDFRYPGLYFIKRVEPYCKKDTNEIEEVAEMKCARDRMPRTPRKVREYYCEECLATMRLFEEEALSVKNMVDKFESIIHIGNF